MQNFFGRLLVFGICVIVYSCATPSSPTGGPRDEEPPAIEATQPKTGTVEFEGDHITLHFSEFVDRSSFSQALLIEPDFGLIYELDWGRKSVSVEFDKKLPDLTTVIFSIGTDFSDLNGNSLGSPVKIAISTGPEIDEGKLMGTVLDARTGEKTKGKRVLLYRLPVDLSQPANYIAETDTGGVARFSYLRQGEYKAFWVDDRNRNKIWDRERERAQPFKQETITLKKAGEDTLGAIFIANSDTSEPAMRGIGLFSNQRLRLRFSEDIILTDSTHISVQDTLGNAHADAYPLYISPVDPYVLFAYSQKPLSPEKNFQLHIENIVDKSGNELADTSQNFTGSAQEDTTSQRLIQRSQMVQSGIYPTQSVEVTYAKPITHAAIRDSVQVVQGDKVISPWKHLDIHRNKLHIQPDSSWKEGVSYTIKVWNPISESHVSITPTIWHKSALGALNITFADSTTKKANSPTHLVLSTATGQQVADTTFTKQIEIDRLAPMNYQLILYQDLNGNGMWDPGQIEPFKAPEPYYIRNEIPVQEGFTSDLSVGFTYE